MLQILVETSLGFTTVCFGVIDPCKDRVSRYLQGSAEGGGEPRETDTMVFTLRVPRRTRASGHVAKTRRRKHITQSYVVKPYQRLVQSVAEIGQVDEGVGEV